MDEWTAFLNARLDEAEAAALATVTPRPAADGMTDDTAALNRTPNTGRLSWTTDVQADDDERVVGYCVISTPDTSGVAAAWGLERGTGAAVAAHIARHDPGRALREVTAGRAILEWHRPEWDDYADGDGIERATRQCAECEPPGTPDNWPCRTVRALAAVWNDHPDYPG